jgi:hypothetical protein
MIREDPAFVSVARESDVIWNPYVHPARNEWRQEGLAGRRLGDEEITAILNEYANKALPATVWKRWSRSGIMESPTLSRLVRRIYPVADSFVTAIRKVLPDRGQHLRLVDKSVHFGLWLPAIHQVFPDALFIHLVRDGRKCIRSMMNGWLDPERFNTYLLPENLRKGTAKYWCFPMPACWQEYLDLPLAERVARQWVAIQSAILDGLDTARKENRYLHVRLEDLAGNPLETLHAIAEYIETPSLVHYEKLAASMPVVNASREDYLSGHDDAGWSDRQILDIIGDMQVKLGYSL